MLKFTYNTLISLLLLSIICLAAFNKTVEGLVSDSYKTDDLDVIYHTDETKDYNKLLTSVTEDPNVKAAFDEYDKIKDPDEVDALMEKIRKDPTILVDLRSRLAAYIDKYKSSPDKAAVLDVLLSHIEDRVKNTDYIIDGVPTVNSTVKDFAKLLKFVLEDTQISGIFESNPMLDKIKSKLENNPEMLENAEVRLKKEIDAAIAGGSTDADKTTRKTKITELMTAITRVVKAKKNDYILQLALTDKLGTVTYNQPGYFRFGPSSYVPNYEDSVFLSRLTNINWRTPVVDLASTAGISGAELGGFCSFNKSNPSQVETECGKLNKYACASTSCCALLGGEKCVAGNESGPTMKSNFSDIYIRNKDHYYYQGKCYGNCPA